jgi:hypothetical protein
MQDLADPTDPLSPLGRKLLKLDANAYGKLVPGDDAGNATARDLLQGVKAADLITANVARREEADALLSGLWLYFDWLDASHRISQSIETPTGSFWHAIMHRREGDFSNSKYWYARCASHPILPSLAAAAGQMVNSMPADKSLFRLIATGWNPNAFVDLVEQVHDDASDPRHSLAVSLQRLEWQTLFNHGTRAASGS